jgi:hypothetical protein
MNGNQKIALVVACAVVVCAAAFVTASSLTSTPLYTIRMEQVSHKMGFLPTAVNGFTYTTESGYTVNYGVSGHGNAEPLMTHQADTFCTCFPWCETSEYTCESQPTCMITCNTCINPTCPPVTCFSTCQGGTCTDPTCPATCPNTCEDTCPNTCSTCSGWTCDPTGCQNTCYTCGITCEYTCPPRKTCDIVICDTLYCQP